jgi:hypothetical protein
MEIDMSISTRPAFGLGSLVAIGARPVMTTAADATAFEKVELAQLTPQLHAQVEARMKSGQTVRVITFNVTTLVVKT